MASLVTTFICLIVAYRPLGQVVVTPLPPATKPVMREQAQMGRRLGKTLQYGCIGLGAALVFPPLVIRSRQR